MKRPELPWFTKLLGYPFTVSHVAVRSRVRAMDSDRLGS